MCSQNPLHMQRSHSAVTFTPWFQGLQGTATERARAVGVEVGLQALHEGGEAPEGVRLVLQHRQQRCRQIAHSLPRSAIAVRCQLLVQHDRTLVLLMSTSRGSKACKCGKGMMINLAIALRMIIPHTWRWPNGWAFPVRKLPTNTICLATFVVARLAVAEVEVVHRVAEADAAQGLHVGVLRPGEEGLRPVGAPHVLVNPRLPLRSKAGRITVKRLHNGLGDRQCGNNAPCSLQALVSLYHLRCRCIHFTAVVYDSLTSVQRA